MAPPRLPPQLLALMTAGVSVIVGSRDQQLRPSVMRAVGSRVAPDGSEVTVFLARRQSARLLQDIAATGHIAVVFSHPESHRTVQLKATRAEIGPAAPADLPLLAAYLQAMEREIAQVGFPPAFTRAMLSFQPDDLAAVRFVPEQAFDQTPGPRAGVDLGGAR